MIQNLDHLILLIDRRNITLLILIWIYKVVTTLQWVEVVVVSLFNSQVNKSQYVKDKHRTLLEPVIHQLTQMPTMNILT